MKAFLFIFFLAPIILSAQKEFAPIGAVWNYEGKSEFNGTNCSGNHIQYRVVDELFVDNKDCSLIKSYKFSNNDSLWHYTNDSLIVYETESKIYFQQDSIFLLLFDFGASIGDTIVRYDPFDRGLFTGTYYSDTSTQANKMEMVVSELWNVDFEGKNISFKTLVLLDPDFYLYDRVIDGVGSMSQSFSGDFFNYVASGCDGELVCYQKENVEYQTQKVFDNPHPGCDDNDFTDHVEDQFDDEINIFPNPFNSDLNIDVENIDQCQVRIIDLQGKILVSKNGVKTFDTSDLIPGIYFVQIFDKEKFMSKKIVKF